MNVSNLCDGNLASGAAKVDDKVLYEEMMTNDDNLEFNLLTSSLLKIHSLYKFCYKLHMLNWRSWWTELYSSCIYEEVVQVKCVGDLPLFILLVSITVYMEV